MIRFVILFAMFQLFSFCQSKKIEKETPLRTKSLFEVYGYKLKSGDYNKYLLYIKKPVLEGEETFLLPKECWIECEGKRIDFAPTKIETNQEFSVYIPSWFFTVETKREINPKNCGQLHFVANRIQHDLNVNFTEVSEKFQAFPQIVSIGDSVFVFVLDLLRLRPIEDEYFPNSERLRIEIKNELGKTIWNSDKDLNFLQVIGQVEPTEVGRMHRYIVPWNRRDNNGNYVTEGKLNVAYILPVKPNNILKIMQLELIKDKK